MYHYKLNSQEQAASGWTDKVVITHADLTEATANTAQTIQMISVPAGAVVANAAYRLVTAFQDNDDNAFNSTTLIVGDGGDTDRFIVSKELNVDGTEVLYWASSAATSSLPYSYAAADTIDAVFGSMAAKSLVNLDAGEVHIFLRIVPSASF